MIYLDHNATSPLLPEVMDAMAPWMGVPANPSSAHRAGQAAAAALETARAQVAALVGGDPSGVVFTSGATEANHLFVRGFARKTPRRRWLASAIEHPCVLDAVRRLEDEGWSIDWMRVGRDGVTHLPDLPPDLAGLSLMAANHETGIVQPFAEARAATRAVGAALHVDATQAAGRIPLDLADADGVVLSGHKLGGPPGIGALILPNGDPFPALVGGGAQERGRRAGTTPTALGVGLGAACAIAQRDLEQRQELWRSLMLDLRVDLARLGAREVGSGPRIHNTICVVFRDLAGEFLVQALDLEGVCVSSGAACASGSLEASPVLVAMGEPHPAGALRISLGPVTEPREIGRFVAILEKVLQGVRASVGPPTDPT